MTPTTSDSITLHLLSRDEELGRRYLTLAASSEREGGMPCRITRLTQLDQKPGGFPDIMVLDIDTMSERALERIPRWRQQGATSTMVMTCRQASPEQLLNAMRAGASDYLSPEPTAEEFNKLMARVLEARQRPAGAGGQGRLITVLSNKGGVGTTTVAINIAAAAAAEAPQNVALVDLVLARGDVSAFLDLPTGYTVVNLATELDRVDASYLRSVMPPHAAGMHVLPAPFAIEEAELVTPVQVSRLLHRLCATFPVVVVDAGSVLTETTLAALDAADRVVLVTLPDLPSVRNTKRALELCQRLRYDPAKLLVVVNRANARERLDRESIETALGCPVQWNLPNDYMSATRAMHRGQVLRALQPPSALNHSLEQFTAAHLVPRANGAAPAPRARHSPPARRRWAVFRRNGTA